MATGANIVWGTSLGSANIVWGTQAADLGLTTLITSACVTCHTNALQ